MSIKLHQLTDEGLNPFNLVLYPELIPLATQGWSLYNLLTSNAWEKLRQEKLNNNNNQCAICKDTRRLSLHEIWSINLETSSSTQTLLDLSPLCDKCHAIKHIGRTSTIISEGEQIELLNHFAKVNNLSSHKQTTIWEFTILHHTDHWEACNKCDLWILDFGKYTELLKAKTKLIYRDTMQEYLENYDRKFYFDKNEPIIPNKRLEGVTA
jgi:hypothetical protein